MKKFKHVLMACVSACFSFTISYSQPVDNISSKQDTLHGWRFDGVTSMNASQSAFVNWAAGGQNTVAGVLLVNLAAIYKDDVHSWDNTLDAGYGLLKQGLQSSPIKTDDKLEFLSKYGRRAFANWYAGALLNFKTQFAKGYSNPEDKVLISDFLAPGYLLGALGLDYKPTPSFSMFISPVTAKMTFVENQLLANAGAYGVEPAVRDANGVLVTPGENFRTELGGYLRSQYVRNITDNILFDTRLALFTDYLENQGNIDVNWNNILGFQINKYLTTTLSTELIYDDDIRVPIDRNEDGIIDHHGPRTQFKEVLAIGFTYKF